MMHSNHRLPFNKHTVSSGQISSGAAQSLQGAVLKCRINHLPLPHLYPKLRGLHDEERKHWLQQGGLTNAQLDALEESIARQEQERVERMNGGGQRNYGTG